MECEFEGLRQGVEEMIEICREGPRWAKVTSVQVEWLDFAGKYSDFEIRI